MNKIAVITSGGDAPGMNAAIRAVTRISIDAGLEVFGVRRGYAGLIEGEIIPLSMRDVSGIIQLGGTFLGTARSEEFKSEAAQIKAIDNLKAHGIEGLVVIGGSGSQQGAYCLHNMGFKVVGVASTIDNDLYGSDISIGVDTALNTIIDSIDKIKTTAKSHERAFLVEVMGRKHGYLALMAGIAGGAEIVITPEQEMEPALVADELLKAYKQGKGYALVITTNGAINNAERMVKYFSEHKEEIGYDLRVTILGHVQRGGAPTAFDRVLASRLAAKASDLIIQDNSGLLVGFINGQITSSPLNEVVSNKKTLDPQMWNLSNILAK